MVYIEFFGRWNGKFSFYYFAGKNVFRVSFRDPVKGQAHTLIANDEHDKRQWLQCLRKVAEVVPVVRHSLSDKRAAWTQCGARYRTHVLPLGGRVRWTVEGLSGQWKG